MQANGRDCFPALPDVVSGVPEKRQREALHFPELLVDLSHRRVAIGGRASDELRRPVALRAHSLPPIDVLGDRLEPEHLVQ